MSKVSCALLPEIADRYEVLDSGAALGRGNGPCSYGAAATARPCGTLPYRASTPRPTPSAAAPSRDHGTHARALLSGNRRRRRTRRLRRGGAYPRGRFVFGDRNLERVADLGEEWEARTGLPLPLGAIVVRRTPPKPCAGGAPRCCAAASSTLSPPGASRPFVRAHARELDDAVTDAHIALFVNEYSLSLGAEGRRALRNPPPALSGTPGTPDASAAEQLRPGYYIYRSRAPCPAHSRMRPVRKPRPARTPPQRTECEKSSRTNDFSRTKLGYVEFFVYL